MKIRGNYEIVYIGPFYTGFFIDTATLINQGYINIQEKVLDNLRQNNKEGWFIEGSKRENVLWDIEFKSVYGGTPKTPISFLGKKIAISNKIVEFNNVKFTFKDGFLFYHDFGAGTFRVTVNIELTQEIEVREYRALGEQFSTKIGDIINPELEQDIIDLETTLRNLAIPINSYEEFSDELKQKGLYHLITKTCLWYHRAFIFELEKNAPITQEDYDKYKDVLFSSQQKGPQNCSLNEYAQVYPSFNFSLFIYDKNNRPQDIRLNRILELAEYYYAATSLLDTILFNEFSKFSSVKEKAPKIKELEQDLKKLRALSEQLELFLLVLKDSIVNFSPSSVIMWRNLDNEWYYTPLLESLKEKSELLDEKVNDKLEELTQKRAATLNRFIKIFTVFAIIGPALEIYNLAVEWQVIDFISRNYIIISSIALPVLAVIIIYFYYYYKKSISS